MSEGSAITTATVITANTTGAIAIIRVSGPGCGSALAKVFKPKSATALDTPSPDRLLFGSFRDESGVIDEGIVSVDVDGALIVSADLNVHGGLRVTERLLAALQRHGCEVVSGDAGFGPRGDAGWRLSRETEQALACCQTRRAVRFVARQSRRLKDVWSGSTEADVSDQIPSLLESWKYARMLIHGATVAVFGPPNAGKSTLINHLADRAELLVSPEPGTTRDWNEVSISLDGVPVRLVDTAGVRQEADALEREAIRRGLSRVAAADLPLLVLDGSSPVPAALLEEIVGKVDATRLIVVASKGDLPAVWDVSAWHEQIGRAIAVSGHSGAGVGDLTRIVLEKLEIAATDMEAPMLISQHQFTWLQQAMEKMSAGEISAHLRTYATS